MNRLYIVVFCFFSFSLPLLIPSWHGKILILTGVIWIFSLRSNQILKGLSRNYFVVVSFAIILIYLAGLIFSENLKYGLSSIESISPLIFLTIVIFNSPVIDEKVIIRVLISFVAGVITLNLASLAFISYDLWDPVNLQSNIILANNAIVKIHPVFLSLYISFCIFFLIDQFFPLDTTNRAKTGWVLFSLVILFVYLIWINSRTGIISFFIAAVFYSLYKFKGRRRFISWGAIGLVLFLIFLLPFSRERFFNAPLQTLDIIVKNVRNDSDFYSVTTRLQILDCSIDLLRGPEFFYGYGTGDFRDVIRGCYQEKGYTHAYEENLDSHNEYFAQMHRHGIIGLVLFVMLLAVPFRHSLKYKSPLLAVFIILFAITALFENVFSAQKGVTFFALICPLLMLLAKQQSKPKEEQTPPV